MEGGSTNDRSTNTTPIQLIYFKCLRTHQQISLSTVSYLGSSILAHRPSHDDDDDLDHGDGVKGSTYVSLSGREARHWMGIISMDKLTSFLYKQVQEFVFGS